MHSITSNATVPVVDVVNTTVSRQVRTPQIKANRKDKARFKRKTLKDIAFDEYAVKTKQIKRYLNQLGYKLDLRLTAAWDAVVFELRTEILALQQQLNETKLDLRHNLIESSAPIQAKKKVVPATPKTKPPVFPNDIDAMNWYLISYNQVIEVSVAT